MLDGGPWRGGQPNLFDPPIFDGLTHTYTTPPHTRTFSDTQAKPIVRVAVEAVRQSDLDALERGLAKLYQADPAVEISVQENGEHVITALGELHLEQCIKVREGKGREGGGRVLHAAAAVIY